MITKSWAIKQIQKKWIEYKTVQQLVMSHSPLPKNWYEQIREAHASYSRTMIPLKELYKIPHFELARILRDAESKNG